MKYTAVIHIFLALTLSPILPGLINRIKAYFAGRYGPPILQAYYDIWKLLRKGAVYSQTTTWIFRVAPLIHWACLVTALAFLPLGRIPALVSFEGDLILVIYLLVLGRFALVLAALDTGSSFEGMGASREMQFAVFAEPALLIALAALARTTDTLSLSAIYTGLADTHNAAFTLRLLLGAGLFILFLTENGRIPIDDPQTHLELTMIHEVIVLDHSAVDFAFIQWAACIKLWVIGTLWAGLWVTTDPTSHAITSWLAGLTALLGVILLTGVIESVTARVRLLRVPQLLVGAGVLCAMALLLTFG